MASEPREGDEELPSPEDVEPPPLLPNLDYDPANQATGGLYYVPKDWKPFVPPPTASPPESVGPPVDISGLTVLPEGQAR